MIQISCTVVGVCVCVCVCQSRSLKAKQIKYSSGFGVYIRKAVIECEALFLAIRGDGQEKITVIK